MYETALRVPDVFAGEFYSVVPLKIGNAVSDIQVVLDYDGPARAQSNDEPLVWETGRIVGKHPVDDALTLDLDIAFMLLKRSGDTVTANRGRGAGRRDEAESNGRNVLTHGMRYHFYLP
jgi:hypothetical protein